MRTHVVKDHLYCLPADNLIKFIYIALFRFKGIHSALQGTTQQNKTKIARKKHIKKLLYSNVNKRISYLFIQNE